MAYIFFVGFEKIKMATTLRGMDTSVDNEISRFLDNRFYPTNTTNFKRFGDVETQMAGIDVQFDFKELKNILVDEKAAAHYINKDIPTFAFELDFLARGEIVPGWFYDEAKKTEYYLCSWIKATKDRYIKAEDITELDIILLDRKALINKLATFGLTSETAAQISREIRTAAIYGVQKKDTRLPFYFFFSSNLAEQPINVIVRKQLLKEIATQHFIITP